MGQWAKGPQGRVLLIWLGSNPINLLGTVNGASGLLKQPQHAIPHLAPASCIVALLADKTGGF